MGVMQGKRILVAVTAGIAAYKIPILVRLLIKQQAEVRVIMTPKSKDFVTPLTLSTVSKKEVFSEFYAKDTGVWNNHVNLGIWADLLVIAPATSNTLSKMANGICDNLVLATYLSATCPVLFAPAMDLDMYKHPATQANIARLQGFGNILIPAETGELASGLIGMGRMASPESILKQLIEVVGRKMPLANKRILITAGPTYEAIDPVRFIGNHSSGKMGIALAYRAAELGATVTLILGPSNLHPRHTNITVHPVTTSKEMFAEVCQKYSDSDIAIAAAAVSDYRPKSIAKQKIKKTDAELTIHLEQTDDILKWMGKHKNKQFLIGFALETENEIEYATRKVKEKNIDLLVLNSLKDKGAGFKTDTNKITTITSSLEVKSYPLKSKKKVAVDILEEVIGTLHRSKLE